MPSFSELLPRLLSEPIEVFARGDGQLSEAAVACRVATALHEAAHVVAAAYYCRGAYVLQVMVSPNGKPMRGFLGGGAFGRTHGGERLSGDSAFCSFVGYAWEELHGDTAHAEDDMHRGRMYAKELGQLKATELVLDEAREFVRVGDGLIRIVAAGILAMMPKTGVLKGPKLRGLVDWLRRLRAAASHAPNDARWNMVLAV